MDAAWPVVYDWPVVFETVVYARPVVSVSVVADRPFVTVCTCSSAYRVQLRSTGRAGASLPNLTLQMIAHS